MGYDKASYRAGEKATQYNLKHILFTTYSSTWKNIVNPIKTKTFLVDYSGLSRAVGTYSFFFLSTYPSSPFLILRCAPRFSTFFLSTYPSSPFFFDRCAPCFTTASCVGGAIFLFEWFWRWKFFSSKELGWPFL